MQEATAPRPARTTVGRGTGGVRSLDANRNESRKAVAMYDVTTRVIGIAVAPRPPAPVELG